MLLVWLGLYAKPTVTRPPPPLIHHILSASTFSLLFLSIFFYLFFILSQGTVLSLNGQTLWSREQAPPCLAQAMTLFSCDLAAAAAPLAPPLHGTMEREGVNISLALWKSMPQQEVPTCNFFSFFIVLSSHKGAFSACGCDENWKSGRKVGGMAWKRIEGRPFSRWGGGEGGGATPGDVACLASACNLRREPPDELCICVCAYPRQADGTFSPSVCVKQAGQQHGSNWINCSFRGFGFFYGGWKRSVWKTLVLIVVSELVWNPQNLCTHSSSQLISHFLLFFFFLDEYNYRNPVTTLGTAISDGPARHTILPAYVKLFVCF